MFYPNWPTKSRFWGHSRRRGIQTPVAPVAKGQRASCTGKVVAVGGGWRKALVGENRGGLLLLVKAKERPCLDGQFCVCVRSCSLLNLDVFLWAFLWEALKGRM